MNQTQGYPHSDNMTSQKMWTPEKVDHMNHMNN